MNVAVFIKIFARNYNNGVYVVYSRPVDIIFIEWLIIQTGLSHPSRRLATSLIHSLSGQNQTPKQKNPTGISPFSYHQTQVLPISETGPPPSCHPGLSLSTTSRRVSWNTSYSQGSYPNKAKINLASTRKYFTQGAKTMTQSRLYATNSSASRK